MTVGGLVDTVFRFNRLCECHLYTAPRNNILGSILEATSNNSSSSRMNDGCSSCIVTTTVAKKFAIVKKLRYFPTTFYISQRISGQLPNILLESERPDCTAATIFFTSVIDSGSE
jgi:hypothetical protein